MQNSTATAPKIATAPMLAAIAERIADRIASEVPSLAGKLGRNQLAAVMSAAIAEASK